MADDAVVAGHERLSDRGQTRYNWQHCIPLIQRKPGALRDAAPFADMPGSLQQLRRALLRDPGGDRVMAQVLAIVPAVGLGAVLVAVELALDSTRHGRLSVEHVFNVLAQLNAEPVPESAATALQVDTAAGPTPSGTTAGAPAAPPSPPPPPPPPRRPTMRELAVELKQLRMHGMAGAWAAR